MFMRQSDMDSACGPHCVAMALITLGLVKRSAVLNQANRKHGLAAQLYRTLADSWFEGLYAQPLFDAIESLKLPLVARLRDNFKGVDAFAVDALRNGNLVLLVLDGLRNPHHRHWVLAVGVSGFQTGQSLSVDTVLALCPSSDPVPLASHNARLHREQATKFTKSGASASWQFDSMPYSSEPVRLTSAISLEPSELHDTFNFQE